MRFCDECGRACGEQGVVAAAVTTSPAPLAPTAPACPVHGPRWRLVRNAPGAAALVVRDGRVLLARRARAPWKGWWEVPGGFVELGEHPAAAAVRELAEELGVGVRLTGLLGVYVHRSLDGETLQTTVYLGETADEPIADPDEVLEWRWFAAGDVPEEMAGDHRRRIDDWLAGRHVALPGGH